MSSIASIGRLFQGASVNRRIFRAVVSISAAGILVKGVATIKEVTVAGVFGRSDAMDAFLAAALIPGLLVNLISESMNQALVPTLIRVREHEGRERAQQLLKSSAGTQATVDTTQANQEAFAAQVLCTLTAWQDDEYCRTQLGLAGPLGAIDHAKLNVNGGSLATGHPFAATGGRIVAGLAKMLAQLDKPAGTARGLISICAAGGQGVVAILER